MGDINLLYEIKRYKHHDSVNFYYLGLEFYVQKKHLNEEIAASYVSMVKEHLEGKLW